MLARKCDRCGSLYEHYEGLKTFKNSGKANSLHLRDTDIQGSYWSRKYYDLCPQCMSQLEDFLDMK